MQQVTSGILFYLLKVIFNLEGSVDQDISCIVKMKKNNIFDILFSAFKNTFVMKGFICFTDIVIHKQFSCHEFIKKTIIVTNINEMNNL